MTLFKSLAPNKVSHLETYLRSANEIKKQIKSTFKFQNGGLLRPDEIAYLDQRYSTPKRILNEFLAAISNPTADFARQFEARYSAVKTAIDAADDEVRVMLANRSKVAFPQTKRKSDIKFSKLSLLDKLAEMTDNQLVPFYPETLPGVSRRNLARAGFNSTDEWLRAAYTTAMDTELSASLISSWWANIDTA